MNRRPFISLLIALLTLCPLALAADAPLKDGREVDVDKTKVPEKVSKAALAAVPGGKIADVDRETKNGKTTWEIGLDVGEKVWEVDVDDDGKVLDKFEKVEEKLKIADVPAPVSAAVKKDFPGSKLTSALKITRAGTNVTFEMTLDTSDKKTWEVVYAADGKQKSKAEVKEEGEAKPEPKKK